MSLQTLKCTNCGEEFVSRGFRLMCPKCRKKVQREKERVLKKWGVPEKVEPQQMELKWWLPQ